MMQSTPEEREAAQARLDALKTEMQGQILTMEDVATCLTLYQEKVNLNSQLLSCGACGYRSYSTEYRDVPLSDPILNLLKLKDMQVEDFNQLGQYKAVASVFVDHDRDTPVHYYLHPETISPGQNGGTPSTTLCEDCLKSLRAHQIPPYRLPLDLTLVT